MNANMVRSFTLFVVLAAFLCTANAKPAANKPSRLSKYITKLCKMSDEQCMAEAIKDILKHAKTGIPELNIPSLEPFVIEEIDLKGFEGLGASIFGGNFQRSNKTRAFARNLVAHHSSEFTVKSMKSNIPKKEISIDLLFPKLVVDGEYDVNLMMFNLPIKSTGPVHVNASEISVKATLSGKTSKRKDETYLQFDTIEIKVDFKDFSLQIENLFKKDQNLNRALNDMIKTQKAELRKIALPMVEEIAGKMVLDMINKILSGLPLEEIFID